MLLAGGSLPLLAPRRLVPALDLPLHSHHLAEGGEHEDDDEQGEKDDDDDVVQVSGEPGRRRRAFADVIFR